MKLKQYIVTLALVLITTVSFAQVGIGTNMPDPSAILDVNVDNLPANAKKGFLPPRMTTEQRNAITSPANGLTIYNTTVNCLQWYNGLGWFNPCTGETVIPGFALTCGSATTNPFVFTVGVPYTGTITVPYTGGNGASYPAGSPIASTGVTGFTATLQAGTLANGNGNLTLTVTGSSSTGGVAYFAFSFVGQSCNLHIFSCGAFVSAGVFKQFSCYNLGATDTTLNPNVPVQAIHGNLYQWGRSDVVATNTTPEGPIPGYNTIAAPSNAWLDDSKTANDPCPAGFRVPTKAQWDGVANISLNTRSGTGTFVSSPTNFGSATHFGPSATVRTLTLPTAGFRQAVIGDLFQRGQLGSYWATTQGSQFPWSINVGGNSSGGGFAIVAENGGNQGFSIRCVSQ